MTLRVQVAGRLVDRHVVVLDEVDRGVEGRVVDAEIDLAGELQRRLGLGFEQDDELVVARNWPSGCGGGFISTSLPSAVTSWK